MIIKTFKLNETECVIAKLFWTDLAEKKQGVVVIPQKDESRRTISAIKADALWDIKKDIKKLYINADIKKIPAMMCQEAEKLSEVFLPSSVTAIHQQAFERCTSLKDINLDSIQYIGYKAFQSSGLEEVVINQHISYVGDEAFSSCEQLNRIFWMSECLIPSLTFYGCRSLNEVSFPPILEGIGAGAFLGTALKEANLSFVVFNDMAYANDLVLEKSFDAETNVRYPYYIEKHKD